MWFQQYFALGHFQEAECPESEVRVPRLGAVDLFPKELNHHSLYNNTEIKQLCNVLPYRRYIQRTDRGRENREEGGETERAGTH